VSSIVLFDRHVLIPFDFLLDLFHLDSAFGYDFLEVLNPFLDCVVVLHDDFSGDGFDDAALLVVHDFAFDGDAFDEAAVLVLHHLFLVGDVVYAALS